MSKIKSNVGDPSPKPKLAVGVTSKSKMSFSFTYFSQPEYFGLSNADPKWFISFLERLKNISAVNLEDYRSNRGVSKTLRYHPIDFNARNIPVSRASFTWIPSSIINNPDEFPFYQFSVSTGKGRFVGFWDGPLFEVVVIDRDHNMQPSDYNDYKIVSNKDVPSEIAFLYNKIEEIKRRCDKYRGTCSVYHELESILYHEDDSNGILINLDPDFLIELKSHNKSIREIVENGILYLPK